MLYIILVSKDAFFIFQ